MDIRQEKYEKQMAKYEKTRVQETGKGSMVNQQAAKYQRECERLQEQTRRTADLAQGIKRVLQGPRPTTPQEEIDAHSFEYREDTVIGFIEREVFNLAESNDRLEVIFRTLIDYTGEVVGLIE